MVPRFGLLRSRWIALSFREARWEPFRVTRFNLSRVDISSSTDNRFLFPDSSDEFDEEYMSHSAGLAWWTGEHKHLFASLTFIHGIEGEFDEIEDSFLLTIGFSAGTTGFFRVP